MNKLIGIVYNEPLPSGDEFSEASRDVLEQVEAIERSLGELCYKPKLFPFTRDLPSFIEQIGKSKVEIIFNLCEAIDEDPMLAGHAAAVYELLNIPFTGSSSSALSLSTDKLLSKRLLEASGIPTPAGLIYEGEIDTVFKKKELSYPVIVKPRFQDASIGIEQGSIFKKRAALVEMLDPLFNKFGPLIIEEYIYGRELNISLIGHPVPRVLPLAEIEFIDFPKRDYHIVGYKAKWDESSFEYSHTPRSFPDDIPPPIVEKIKKTAISSFKLFMLRDYARIDMRIDSKWNTFVLDVNANPCLNPNGGFAAAAETDGITYTRMVELLVSFALLRSQTNAHQAPHNF
ncbi:MAG: hypothetical protein V1753_10220 [Pseudomonadota bacterium]